MPFTDDSFHQLDRESARDFHYFCIYRDLGPQRSIRKAYIHQLPPWRYTKFGRKRYSRLLPGHWVGMSCRNNWHQRALAFDRYLGVERIPVPILRMLNEMINRQTISHKRARILSLD